MSGITDLHFCPCRNAFSETMGWLLALDGATEHLALALVAPDGRVHAQELAGGAQASAKLLPSLKAWMAAQRVQASQLAALVLGRGPGAFTGLRVASRHAFLMATRRPSPACAPLRRLRRDWPGAGICA